MQVVLQGNLKSFPLAQVLMLFSQHGHGGTLDIEAGANRARVFFHNGKVIYAESNDGAGNAGEAVVRTFAWPEGKFTFLDDVALPDRASRVSLDVESIITEATKRAESGYADYAMFRVIDNPLAADKISLEADEFKLLFRIGLGKTFGDLATEGDLSRRELGQKVKTLESAGLVVRVDQKSDSSAAHAAPAAQHAESEPQRDDAPVHEAQPPEHSSQADEREITQEKEVVTRTQEEPMPAEAPEATVMVARPRREDIIAAAASESGDATMFAPPPPPPPSEDAPAASDRTQAGTIPLPPEVRPAPQPVPGGIVFGSLMPDSGDSYPLVDDEYTVGRDDTNSIAVRDGSISAKHARIIRNEMGFWVEDVGSRNGTFVNGEKVSEKRLLSNGDLVRFGKVIMTYHIAEETSSDATTVVG
jgi:hypothetical protein